MYKDSCHTLHLQDKLNLKRQPVQPQVQCTVLMSLSRAQAGTLESMRGELATTRAAIRALDALVADERTASAAALSSIRAELLGERRRSARCALTSRSAVWAEVSQRDALMSAHMESLKRQNARLRNDIASASALAAEYELREADLVSALQESSSWIEGRLAMEVDAVAVTAVAASRDGAERDLRAAVCVLAPVTAAPAAAPTLPGAPSAELDALRRIFVEREARLAALEATLAKVRSEFYFTVLFYANLAHNLTRSP